MSPRQKYYGAMIAGVILGLLAAVSSGAAKYVFVIMLLGIAAYLVFIRCPKCRKRLSSMGDVPGIHGLPDRFCDKCGVDLSAAGQA